MLKKPSDASFVLKKGVFPYDWLTSPERLSETVLPPREAFYDSLHDEECGEETYECANKIWEYFDCKNVGDYMEAYLKTDVLILTDVMEHFRETVMNEHRVEVLRHVSLPGLSWSAMLLHTAGNPDKLEMLKDQNIFLKFESQIRGGICQISHRHSKANNPDVPGYDPRKKLRYLLYIDANNLYGWSMSQNLPCGKFQDVPKYKLAKWKKEGVPDAWGNWGCTLNVDLE